MLYTTSLLVLTFWIYFQTQEATKSPKPWQTQSLKRSLCSVHERCQVSKRKEYPISHCLNLKGRNTQSSFPQTLPSLTAVLHQGEISYVFPFFLSFFLCLCLALMWTLPLCQALCWVLWEIKRWARHTAILEMLASSGERWVQKVKIWVPKSNIHKNLWGV